MRVPHTITPVAGNTQPSLCVAMDSYIQQVPSDASSTKLLDHHILTAGVRWRYERGQRCRVRTTVAYSADQWWHWLADQVRAGTLLWVYGYDLWRQLTALGLWDRMDRGEWLLASEPVGDAAEGPNFDRKRWRGFAVLSDPPTILLCRPKGSRGTVRMVDCRNYGIESMDQITPPMPDLQDRLRRTKVIQPVMEQRAKYNAHGIMQWTDGIITWLRTEQLGSMQSTAAAQAWYTWRRAYLDHPPHVHCHEAALDLEQRAMYGGRCECRFLGWAASPTKPGRKAMHVLGTDVVVRSNSVIWHLDVNSMYPSVCIDAPLPVNLLAYYDHSHTEQWGNICSMNDCIAHVQVRTDSPDYPFRHDGLILYPTGTYWTVLAGPELADAWLHRRVLKIGAYARYVMQPALSRYMSSLYEQRLRLAASGNKAGERLVKRMLVAITGKLASRKWGWADYDPGYRPLKTWCKWYDRIVCPKCGSKPAHEMTATCQVCNGAPAELLRLRAIAGQVQRETTGGIGNDACPAMAAWVQSLARMRLLALIQLCPPKSVYYYDTDSLWVSDEGFDALYCQDAISDTELGCLKIAGRHESVEFRGLKHYVADGKLTCAGLPRALREQPVASVRIDRRDRADTAAADSRLPITESSLGVPPPHTTYRHGMPGADGWVTPLRLGELSSNRQQESQL